MHLYGNTTAHDSYGIASDETSPFLDPATSLMVTPSDQHLIPGSTGDANVQSMAPPPNPRKRKARTLRVDDWEPVKSRVIQLHITEDRPLLEVKKVIESEFPGFVAT